jgi:hypothetical protein
VSVRVYVQGGSIWRDDGVDKVRVRRAGLGDSIAVLTNAAGVSECPGCNKRRKGLNRLPAVPLLNGDVEDDGDEG